MKKNAILVFIISLIIGTGCSVKSKEHVVPVSIQGMHCAACFVQVKKSVEGIDGVDKIRFKNSGGKALVYLSDSTINSQVLIDAVRSAGFLATVESGKK